MLIIVIKFYIFLFLLIVFVNFIACAPPPGAYNPKFSEAIIGAVIPTSERFIDPKSPAGSTCSESNSVSSVPSVPTFRTVSIF